MHHSFLRVSPKIDFCICSIETYSRSIHNCTFACQLPGLKIKYRSIVLVEELYFSLSTGKDIAKLLSNEEAINVYKVKIKYTLKKYCRCVLDTLKH